MLEEISVETLVKDYGPMVSSVCRRMLQDPETAQDASQQVWIEVIKGLPGFCGRSKISTWIYSIAHRVIMSLAADEKQYSTRFLRRYFNSGDMELPSGEDPDRDIWVRQMCDKCLTGMLHCLDNEARLIYIFRDIVGLSYGEIAQIHRADEQTVRQIVSRTRKKLRNFLKDECALFNPGGACRCRMSKWVAEIDLPQEYEKLRSVARSANVYLESETVLPGKNYWLAYL